MLMKCNCSLGLKASKWERNIQKTVRRRVCVSALTHYGYYYLHIFFPALLFKITEHGHFSSWDEIKHCLTNWQKPQDLLKSHLSS